MISTPFSGSRRVEGDEEEDGIDDLEHEFDYANSNTWATQQVDGKMLTVRLDIGHSNDDTASGVSSCSEFVSPPLNLHVPLLGYHKEVNHLIFLHLCMHLCVYNCNHLIFLFLDTKL